MSNIQRISQGFGPSSNQPRNVITTHLSVTHHDAPSYNQPSHEVPKDPVEVPKYPLPHPTIHSLPQYQSTNYDSSSSTEPQILTTNHTLVDYNQPPHEVRHTIHPSQTIRFASGDLQESTTDLSNPNYNMPPNDSSLNTRYGFTPFAQPTPTPFPQRYDNQLTDPSMCSLNPLYPINPLFVANIFSYPPFDVGSTLPLFNIGTQYLPLPLPLPSHFDISLLQTPQPLIPINPPPVHDMPVAVNELHAPFYPSPSNFIAIPPTSSLPNSTYPTFVPSTPSSFTPPYYPAYSSYTTTSTSIHPTVITTSQHITIPHPISHPFTTPQPLAATKPTPPNALPSKSTLISTPPSDSSPNTPISPVSSGSSYYPSSPSSPSSPSTPPSPNQSLDISLPRPSTPPSRSPSPPSASGPARPLSRSTLPPPSRSTLPPPSRSTLPPSRSSKRKRTSKRSNYTNDFQRAFHELVRRHEAGDKWSAFRRASGCSVERAPCANGLLRFCEDLGGEFLELAQTKKFSRQGSRTTCECARNPNV